MSSTDSVQKKPWQKIDNWVAWGVLGALGYGALTMADKILPLVIRVLENTLYTVGLTAVLAAVGFLVVNKDIHRLVWALYKTGIRWLTNLVITIDPIGIMKGAYDDALAKIKEITRTRAALKEQIRSLEELISSNNNEYQWNMKMMSKARTEVKGGNKDMRKSMVLSSRQAGRLKESNVTFQGLLNKMKSLYDRTGRMQEAAEFMAEDMKQTITVEERKRNAIRSAYKAMSLARAIVQGDKQRELYDAALEHVNNDYFAKLGEIEQFMEDSQHFINTMDLQNGVYEEDALLALDAWDDKESLLGQKVRVDDSYDPPQGEEEPEHAEERERRQSYADLFDVKK